MLHRKSFKSAKCKTGLKLAVSRIKLLKNKREAHVRQMKRELAQLLESGQDRTARIRVEHVVREEKTKTAYDLIEIYCELIAARLPIIESQKNCPIDLKEAISSVIFASPRCSDIPELMDVRKHLTAKYGKEFVSAAIELRPDCGVNRMLVEKLSAKAPDGPTKIKILSDIAKEHNVKWDPNSSGENDIKSLEESRIETSTLENASYVEPPQVQAPSNHDGRGHPITHVHTPQKGMNYESANLYEQNARFSAKEVGDSKSTTSGKFNPEMRSPGLATQEMDFRYSNSEDGNSFSMGKQNWNMVFKDATSAAQAAAESAERASMAARAAVQLSSGGRNTGQYSTVSRDYSAYGLGDEATHGSRHLCKDSANSTFHRSNFGMHNEQTDGREQDNLAGASNDRDDHENAGKISQSASLKSDTEFIDDKTLGNSSQTAYTHPQKNFYEPESSEFLYDMSMKKQGSNSEVDFESEMHVDHFVDRRIGKQSRRASSRSQSSTSSDDHSEKLNSQMPRNDAVEDLFITDERTTRVNYKEINSYDNTAVFDDSESDDDDYKFGVENKGQESSLYFSSPNRKSPVPFKNKYEWVPGEIIDKAVGLGNSRSHFSTETSSPAIYENSTKCAASSQQEDMFPTTFDDSNGSSSESEEDLHKSKLVGSKNHGLYLREKNNSSKSSTTSQSASHEPLVSSSMDKRNLDFNRKRSSLVGSDTMEEHPERNQSIDLTDVSEESSVQRGKELNYGVLMGGFRNKGYRQPPYAKNSSGKASSSRGDTIVKVGQSSTTVRSSFNSGPQSQDLYTREVSGVNKSPGSGVLSPSSNSDNDDLVEDSQKIVNSTQNPYIQKPATEVNNKSSSRAVTTYFDSNSSDSEDDEDKQTSASNFRPVSGFSRRTKASPSMGRRSVNVRDPVFPEVSGIPDDSGLERKTSSGSSFNTRNQQKPSFRTKSSDRMGSSEQHGLAKQVVCNQPPESQRSLHEESIKLSARVQQSSSLQKRAVADNSGRDSPSAEKASHVHPKLPDYDSLTAHFQSLRQGRQ
ncbi:IST1-like protein [Quillaja saponaria]|uniref:IST1-like protein n=1 Tax=Quillaja saponaria TaxID=32244 RepID=A0AAD7Q2P4_QUISA|nr:IST1-like protein [Quillaja saponaria]